MIFPDVRLSDLRKDAELKRGNLTQSAQAIKASLQEFAHPIALIKKHPFMLLGGLGAVVAVVKITGKLVKGRGWLGRIMSFGGIMLMKKVLPVAVNGLWTSLDNVQRKRRS